MVLGLPVSAVMMFIWSRLTAITIEGVHNIRTADFNHYSRHFKSHGADRPEVGILPFQKLSFGEAGNLTKHFSLEEVKQAVWHSDSYKSLGPDGINFGFIKQFWELIK
jgi:hypothetical protein